jgi:hypothetical protein
MNHERTDGRASAAGPAGGRGGAALALVLYLVPIPLWIAAWASGAYVGLFT